MFICALKLIKSLVFFLFIYKTSQQRLAKKSLKYDTYKITASIATVCCNIYLLQCNAVLWEVHYRFSDLVSKRWMPVDNLLDRSWPKLHYTVIAETWATLKSRNLKQQKEFPFNTNSNCVAQIWPVSMSLGLWDIVWNV